MINQALLYRRTGSKLIDNATRAVEIAVEQGGLLLHLATQTIKW